MRQEHLSNDRTESNEPQIYHHICGKCGAHFTSPDDDSEYCDVCVDDWWNDNIEIVSMREE